MRGVLAPRISGCILAFSAPAGRLQAAEGPAAAYPSAGLKIRAARKRFPCIRFLA